MTLITIDALSWGTGKMFEYEACEPQQRPMSRFSDSSCECFPDVMVVLLVEELDACYLVAAVVMATAEIFIEFVASAVTPFLYRTA
eukprot:5302754-Amphidinium_carterae.1